MASRGKSVVGQTCSAPQGGDGTQLVPVGAVVREVTVVVKTEVGVMVVPNLLVVVLGMSNVTEVLVTTNVVGAAAARH